MPAEFMEDTIKIKTNNRTFGIGMLLLGPVVWFVAVLVTQQSTASIIAGVVVSMIGVVYLFMPEKYIWFKPEGIIITTTKGEVKDQYDPQKLVNFKRSNTVQNNSVTAYSFTLTFENRELKLKGGYFGGVDVSDQVEGLLKQYINKHYGVSFVQGQ